MADPTPAELQAQIDTLKTQVADLKTSGFWAGLDARIQANPKVAAMVASLFFSLLTWAGTYFSVPTQNVPPQPPAVHKDEAPAPKRKPSPLPGDDAPPVAPAIPKEPEKKQSSGPYNVPAIRAFLRPSMVPRPFDGVEYAKAD